MGKLFSGSQTQTTKNEPLKWQEDQLKSAFGSASDIYSQSKDTPFYQGDLYAQMGQMTRDGINKVGDFASNNTTGQTIREASSPLMGNGQMSVDAMRDLYSMTGEDATASNIATAQAYANDPALQGTINAANRDTARSLYEGELPEINRSASGSGNMNSSRAGMADAIARRGADDRMADTSAAIRSDAYNRGLTMAENSRNTKASTLSNISSLANNGLSLGINGQVTGDEATMGNYDAMIRAGQLDQQDRQGGLDANFAKWQGQDTRSSDLLNRYYSIIGANNWGGTQTTKTSSTPSIFGAVTGLATTAAGLGAFGPAGLGGLFGKKKGG